MAVKTERVLRLFCVVAFDNFWLAVETLLAVTWIISWNITDLQSWGEMQNCDCRVWVARLLSEMHFCWVPFSLTVLLIHSHCVVCFACTRCAVKVYNVYRVLCLNDGHVYVTGSAVYTVSLQYYLMMMMMMMMMMMIVKIGQCVWLLIILYWLIIEHYIKVI